MTFAALSAYSEEFLALRRSVARSRPYQNDQDRRSLRHREKLLRSFIAFWHDRGCPWPIRATLLLDWIALGADPQHPYRDQAAFLHSARFPATGARLRAQHGDTRKHFSPLRRRRAPHLYSDRTLFV